MSGPAVHDRLVRRVRGEGVVITRGALHVGAGDGGGGVEASDMPVARNGHGTPYVPGSSFRGSLRAGIEALLRGLGKRVCDPFERQGEDDAVSCSERVARRRKALRDGESEISEALAFELAWDGSCEVCRLFGHSFLASRVRIADLPLVTRDATYVRDGVGIDRDLRTASRGILYQFEAVPEGARFTLRIEVDNPEDHELGLLLVGLDLFADGGRTLGGKGSRGLGAVSLDETTWTELRPADFFDDTRGRVLAPDDLAACRRQARERYVGAG